MTGTVESNFQCSELYAFRSAVFFSTSEREVGIGTGKQEVFHFERCIHSLWVHRRTIGLFKNYTKNIDSKSKQYLFRIRIVLLIPTESSLFQIHWTALCFLTKQEKFKVQKCTEKYEDWVFQLFFFNLNIDTIRMSIVILSVWILRKVEKWVANESFKKTKKKFFIDIIIDQKYSLNSTVNWKLKILRWVLAFWLAVVPSWRVNYYNVELLFSLSPLSEKDITYENLSSVYKSWNYLPFIFQHNFNMYH